MGTYEFFDGNNGGGGNLGSVNSTPGEIYNLSVSGAPVTNGRANSVTLKSVAQYSALVVFDNPTATLSSDSFCVINVLATTSSTGYNVGSFERSTSNTTVAVTYNSNSGTGLDGKVSNIETFTPWPTATPRTVLTATNKEQEPSGLAIFVDGTHKWLYQVSDNGNIARIDLNDANGTWTSHNFGTTKSWAFESVCTVGTKLIVGVEGGETDQVKPLLREFDPTDTTDSTIGSFTGSVWSLDFSDLGSNKGMEAMTFVPSADCPSDWDTTNNSFDGFFLIGLQVAPAVIYVFNLPKANGDTQDVGIASTANDNIGQVASFDTGLLNLKMSDMCFANSRLWVLYDDKYDALQQLQLTPSISLVSQSMPTISQAGTSFPTKNCEGLTFDGSTLFVALDQNSNSLTNYVFQYESFAML